ncbi:P-loop containing nucleoside triphosphate hydrolase protein [Staphylotrichum tortipilum]|uniref:RNA helicase n=1 Tax=Staphylotrichum tortipilum TaxID=2831512 RepID=A0AAN6RUH8_9PEZI|nr:P-loop containing nucleoside triphosphate hydrolase protein [Staphylotrichum longicolle]
MANPRLVQNYQLLQNLVETRFFQAIYSVGKWAKHRAEWEPFGIESQHQLDTEIALFRKMVDKAFTLAMTADKTSRKENPLFWNLRNTFIRSDTPGLDRELRHSFQTFLMRQRFPAAVAQLQTELADLRYPYEWYPATRMMQRTVHLHVGPTNSGKTYNALLALERARTGVYAGPLRLLAHETFTRFTAKGKPCALVTGEEVRIPDGSESWIYSCTVEMTPFNTKVDVAVIDEIQMIANEERGWAWTQAFLGVQAKEVHLCGEERVVPLIQDLCARIGDKCIVHEYRRLNPLTVMPESLDNNLRNLRKGDAVVAFSKLNIHRLRKGIEKETGRRCAIVYGSLPPETRASQAALFNDPNNDYDFLVASDAIGMGLNLEVKRVIFDAATKFDGVAITPLTVPEVKQIGGRAGRFRSAARAADGGAPPPAPGLITTMDPDDHEFIRTQFGKTAPPIQTAGILPPASVIERFHSHFPSGTPIEFVLSRLREMSRLSPQFHMCNFSEPMAIAEIIKPFKLSIRDSCILLHVPANMRSQEQELALKAFARCLAGYGSGHLLDFPEIDLEVLDETPPRGNGMESTTYLQRLESLHMVITMYLWLSYRYQGVFQSQTLAFEVKKRVTDKIADRLENLGFESAALVKQRKRLRSKAAQQELQRKKVREAEEKAEKE